MIQTLSEESLKGIGLIWGVALYSLWATARRKESERYPEIMNEFHPFHPFATHITFDKLYETGRIVEAMAFEHWIESKGNKKSVSIPLLTRKVAAWVLIEQEQIEQAKAHATADEFADTLIERMMWLRKNGFLVRNEVKPILEEFFEDEGERFAAFVNETDPESWLLNMEESL